MRLQARKLGKAGLIAALTVLSVLTAVVPAGAAPPGRNAGRATASAPSQDLASYVSPFVGTGGGGTQSGQIDTFPGADVPFGMVQWSPDTPSRPPGGGYNYADSDITGFSLTHLSGPGCPAFGDVGILPSTGGIGSQPWTASQVFSHAQEQASPGYYGVSVGSPAIQAQLSTTLRTGIGYFTYPATKQANLIIKAAHSEGGNSSASVSVMSGNQIAGSATSSYPCTSPAAYTIHYVITFDRPFRSQGTWQGGTVSPGGSTAQGSQAGAWVTFDTTANPLVKAKVAISYVSQDNAVLNLQREDPGWSLAAVRDAARARWDNMLGRIQVAGGTQSEQETFYSMLYHAFVEPSVFSDVNGEYVGFDNQVHEVHPPAAGPGEGNPAGPAADIPGTAQYANFSGWDIYRSEIPLLAWLAPRETSDMMQSLVNDATQGGWLPKWPLAHGYTDIMNGDSADPMVAAAYAFGARAFDTHGALAAMVKGASQVPASSQLGQGWYEERSQLADYLRLGYVPNTMETSFSPVPNGASETLEYATDDFAISRLAKNLGRPAQEQQFLARSANWENVFDTALGYIEPRDAQGAFPPPPAVQVSPGAFGQSGFQEGNAAQYTWMVPQDLHDVFAAMGGSKRAVSRLDTFFTSLQAGANQPNEWAGNEPNLGTPWEYDYAGAPWKTQHVVHQLITDLYGPTPAGEPGNDDLGAMSSWYVWAAIGLYPETPGVANLVVGSPLFSRVVVSSPTGRRLQIVAPAASASNPYVRSLTVDGSAWSKPWLPASMVVGPGRGSQGPATTTLQFALGPSPDASWGAAPADAPPSYRSSAPSFPASTAAALVTTPSRVQAAPGASTHVDIGIDNSSGGTPASVTWSAAPPSGVSIAPASGTLTAGAGASTSQAVTVSVAPGTAEGYYQVPMTGRAANGALLRQAVLLVGVAPPGSVPPVSTILGPANADNGLSQVDSSDGHTSAGTFGGLSARETAAGAGDPYERSMYFKVDPAIAQNGVFKATFTVQYYDTGSGSWSLQYDSTSSPYTTYPNAVTLTGSNTWKTATFSVTDADFVGGQNAGADFRLVGLPAVPIVVHKVTVVATPAG